MSTPTLTELTLLGAIFLFSIKEFFAYLKAKNEAPQYKQDNKVNDDSNKIFLELRTMNENHLHSIQEVIQSGNTEIVRAINEGNQRTAQLLGEIKGNLQARQ